MSKDAAARRGKGRGKKAKAGTAGVQPDPPGNGKVDADASALLSDAEVGMRLTGPEELGAITGAGLEHQPEEFAVVPAVGATEAAALLAQISTGLRWPPAAWAGLEPEARAALANEIVRTRNDAAVQAADAGTWVLAPEAALLQLVPDAKRAQLAEDLLLARAGLAAHQTARAAARTGVIVATAGLMGELKADREKWRSIADLGKSLLLGTTVFCTAALAYVLLKLANDSGFNEWTIPVIVFALAVFAASPAAILLLERPLRGVDSWTPGGEQTDEADEAPPKPTDAASKPAGKATGAAGYSKGPGRPD